MPARSTRGPIVGSPVISICIPTADPGASFERCLDSLRMQRSAPPYELLVCLNGGVTEPEAVIDLWPGAKVVCVTRRHPGAARNALIQHARGDLLLFLDDDVTLAPDLLYRLATLARRRTNEGVFGGPNVTPPNSTWFQRVQGAVLASLLGSGPVRRRYGRHPAGAANERFFILCNLAVRREVMTSFDPDLVCAEENALLMEMSRRGIAMHYDPKMMVFHDRRDSLSGFAKQLLKYGRGRGQIIRRRPYSARLEYLAPPALVLYLSFLPLLASLMPWAAGPGAAYVGMCIAGGTKIGITMKSFSSALLACTLVAFTHVCYGIGVLLGIARPKRGHATVPTPVLVRPNQRSETA
ncbi:MAG: glycosyltransferase [Actinomycetota bacterium]